VSERHRGLYYYLRRYWQSIARHGDRARVIDMLVSDDRWKRYYKRFDPELWGQRP
jgi:hypothetical protein